MPGRRFHQQLVEISWKRQHGGTRGSLEQVAQLFSMHRRTLNRRLAEQDCTFQGLVNEVRYEIARQLLANTYMPISQIAATLDYKDAPYFLPRLSPLVRQSAG